MVSNFDVMKRMSADNKQIMLCTDVLNMSYSQKTQGTKVQVGVPGNPIVDIYLGKKTAVLLIWNTEEFNETKSLLAAEELERDRTREQP